MTKIYGKKLWAFIFKYIHLRRISIFKNPVGSQYEDKISGGQLDNNFGMTSATIAKSAGGEFIQTPSYTDFVPVGLCSFNVHGSGFSSQANFYKYPPYAVAPVMDTDESSKTDNLMASVYNSTTSSVTGGAWLRGLMVRRYLQEPIEFEQYMTD